MIRVFLLFGMLFPVWITSASPSLSFKGEQCAYWGGDRVTIGLELNDFDSPSGRLNWSLNADRAPLQRGEESFSATSETEIEITLPVIKSGIVQPVTLRVEYATGEGILSKQKTFWIHSKETFLERVDWLNSLQLKLYDPEGGLEELFDEAEISYDTLNHVDNWDSITNGVVLVGEGINLEHYPQLIGDLAQVSQRGCPVLCLAFAGGSFDLKDLNVGAPSTMRWEAARVVKHLDKKIDVPGPESTITRLRLISGVSEVEIEATQTAEGWPWLELSYESPGRSIIFCGFPLMEQWGLQPSGQTLFLRMLERIIPKGENE